MWHNFASARLWVGVKWCHTLMNYGEKFQKPSGGCVWFRTVVVRVGDALERFQAPFSAVEFLALAEAGRVIATCLRRFHVTFSHRHRLNLTLLWCLYRRLEILSLLHRCNSGWWKTNPRRRGQVGETSSRAPRSGGTFDEITLYLVSAEV